MNDLQTTPVSMFDCKDNKCPKNQSINPSTFNQSMDQSVQELFNRFIIHLLVNMIGKSKSRSEFNWLD